MMEYILDWDAHNNVIDEDAPVNATAPLYQQIRHLSEVEIDIKTRTKKSEKLYTRILKRYDY